MTEAPWRVLIVDDEPPIRAELRYLLEQDARTGAIDEAGGAGEAVEKILADRPDVLFLDIQMPGTSGVHLADTLSGLKNPPVIVFVTAFAEYAAAAFELDAVDYVLKPVEDTRLMKALDKVEAALGARVAAAPAEAPQRISVEHHGKRSYIPVKDVLFFEARADYALACTAAGRYLVYEPLSALEKRLEPSGFCRVHRSFLANIDEVHAVDIDRATGLMELTFAQTGDAVPVSRRRAAAIKQRLGLG